jgi:hypothetical protein
MKTVKIIVCLLLASSLNGIVPGNTKVPEKKPQPAQHSFVPEKSATPESKGRSQKTISHPAVLTEHFGKEFLESVPADIYSVIPSEALKIFDNSKCKRAPSYEEWEEIFMPVASYIGSMKERKTLIKTKVMDDAGKPVKSAVVRLTQTLRFRDSGPLWEFGDNPEPFKIKQTTDINGECIFNDMDAQSFFSVYGHLLFSGKLPENNILMEVRATGLQTVKKEFVNIDRTSLALGLKYVEFMLRHKDLFSEKEREAFLIGLIAKNKVVVPEENTRDVIEIKVVLRKEAHKNA